MMGRLTTAWLFSGRLLRSLSSLRCSLRAGDLTRSLGVVRAVPVLSPWLFFNSKSRSLQAPVSAFPVSCLAEMLASEIPSFPARQRRRRKYYESRPKCFSHPSFPLRYKH